MTTEDYLNTLNAAQLRAVMHSPDIPLQILAGPGSGKTKVLTCRIAHLISKHSISPQSICAVTFTNKAANEMRERLTKLIGIEQTNQIKLGTFHAICSMFLRKYAKLVGLDSNFTICDADESKNIIKKLLKTYRDELEAHNIVLAEATVISRISKAKAKGVTSDGLRRREKKGISRGEGRTADGSLIEQSFASIIDDVVAEIHVDYAAILRRNNSLDFDDLVLFGKQLFAEHPTVSRWCRHILVDEFQDTNTTQYELMRHIAATSRCVTIVGDPDQSIYGWRSAEVENLARMKRDLPNTQQLFLEQNYRSTASIISCSLAIVSQDKSRTPKTLHTTHPTGPTPVLRSLPYEQNESAFLASEIKRLVAYSGGMLSWGDFVILLRYNSLSRSIESALQKEGIPNRVLNGHKFFERLEVKDILAYLQLLDNPLYVPAFMRAINVPSRGIGEKSVSELLATAQRLGLSPIEVVEKIFDNTIPDIKPAVKRKLTSFVPHIRRSRTSMQKRTRPSDLIRDLLQLLNYEGYLMKTQPDWESRWDNVQELINFASQVEMGTPMLFDSDQPEDDPSEGEEWNSLAEFDQDQLEDDGIVEAQRPRQAKGKEKQTEERYERHILVSASADCSAIRDTPLRLFLQASMLSTGTEVQGNENDTEKVTISTCHAAKGLEWPIVMIPAVEKGTFPSARAEDVHEERRLLYVACTRAKALLYLTHSTARMMSGEVRPKELSEFVITALQNSQTVFTDQIPCLSASDREVLAQVLNRSSPSDAEVARKIAEYNRTTTNPWDGSAVPSSTPWFSSTYNKSAVSSSVEGSCNFLTARAASSVLQDSLKAPTTATTLFSTRGRVLNVPSNTALLQLPTAGAETASKQRKLKQSSLQQTHLHANLSSHRVPVTVYSDPKPDVVSETPQSSVCATPSTGALSAIPVVPVNAAKGKRRLGMGRTTVGYPNKKFKAPLGGGGQ
ncbi:UvrD-helicase-domain-containing protein [Wolfiporia cocos MD-104 SS10]|uniref:DNA 3'-5' helicase n=1 Tax=Wolfiporia cocos (strain MD-104) TaxID=742152 RepID=A0A2H3JK23_WOLCO|nr:UvrD-helicase-domain-containing protein [Wolfiporia cocos MD-104 SS10]